VALAWCFPDERSAATEAILARLNDEPAVVPSLWFLEMTNILALAERKGRIVQSKAEAFMATIDGILIDVDYESSQRAFKHLYPLCHAHGLTSYDAAYLDLALRRHLPLATLDSALRNAATSIGIPLLGK
jgi:predicted nucleic acid-binding protein